MALDWFRQQKLLKNETEIRIWKAIGLSFWATNLWLLTDTILAYPYIAYAYFMLNGILLAFGRNLRQEKTFSWSRGELVMA